jgi:hypothetical protein
MSMACGLFGCSNSTKSDLDTMGGVNGAAGMSPGMMIGAAGSSSPTAMGSGGTQAGGPVGTMMTSGGTGGHATTPGSGGGMAQTSMSGAGAGGASMAGSSAGMSGTSGGAGAAGMAMSAAGAGAGSGAGGAGMQMDLGKGDGKDVVTIGDSWMNLIVDGIEPDLDMAAGHMYRHYAIPGTIVLNDTDPSQIPGQYEQAKKDGKITTVVMTGGGNDILGSNCSDTACNPIVDMVNARLTKLMMEMATDGVQDVVLISYTYPSDMTKRESLDYSRMLAATSCTLNTMPRCHYLDSSKLTITLRDGIHPDAAGYVTVANAAYKLMTDDGVRR